MSLAELVVTAVRLEGRTKAEVAGDYGVSPRWVYELCRRFDRDGEAGLLPRSRRPRTSPTKTLETLEDEIVSIRKELADQGLDAGAATVAVHLERHHGAEAVPSVATIWRIRDSDADRPVRGGVRFSIVGGNRQLGAAGPDPHTEPFASCKRRLGSHLTRHWTVDGRTSVSSADIAITPSDSIHWAARFASSRARMPIGCSPRWLVSVPKDR